MLGEKQGIPAVKNELSKRKQKIAAMQREATKQNNSKFRAAERNFKSRFMSPDMSEVVNFSNPDQVSELARKNIQEIELSENLFDLDDKTFTSLGAQSSTLSSDFINSENSGKKERQLAYTLKNHPGLIVIPNPFTDLSQRKLLTKALCGWARLPNRNNLNPFFELEGSNSIFELHLKDLSSKGVDGYKEPMIKTRFSDNSTNYEQIPNTEPNDILEVKQETTYIAESDLSVTEKQITTHENNIEPLQKKCKDKTGKNVNSTSEGNVTIPKSEFYRSDHTASELLDLVRWTTIGKQYNWTTKSYDIKQEVAIESDLESLVLCIVRSICGAKIKNDGKAPEDSLIINDYDYTKYKVESGVINYYGTNDTLLAHVDRSEENMDAPLISISLGCSGIYLLGGSSKQDEVTPILLNSGDIIACCGEARAAYHGVPRIFENSCPKFLTDPLFKQTKNLEDKGTSKNPVNCGGESWLPFANYISRHRINFNVRQCNTDV